MISGLFDAHDHLSYLKTSALPVLLVNGVTSVANSSGQRGAGKLEGLGFQKFVRRLSGCIHLAINEQTAGVGAIRAV